MILKLKFFNKYITVIIIVAILLLFKVAFNNNITIREYHISSNKINNPITIVLVADLHSTLYSDNKANPVRIIKNINPDLIMLAGDIFDDKTPDIGAEIFLSGIQDIAPIFYVTGNHEYWAGRIPEFLHILDLYNVTSLDSEFITIDIKENRLLIAGISDPEKDYYYPYKNNSINRFSFLSEISDDEKYNILLSHRPEPIEKYTAYPIDLVLSGHTHGGQVRIPFLLNGLYAPNQGWFPKYAGGFYRINSCDMIVSRGMSINKRLPRIFNPPEIVVIHLSNE